MEENANIEKRKRNYEEHKKGTGSKKREVICLKCDNKVKLKPPFRLCPRCRSLSETYAMEDHSIGSY